MNNALRVTYPRTNIKKLNDYFKEILEKEVSDFLLTAAYPHQENMTYNLDITFDEYEYGNLLTFIFYISKSTGGAHPNSTIKVVNYNKNTANFITIKDLEEKDSKLLEKLSIESRKRLINNPKITSKDMLESGIKPVSENFKNFYLTKEGIVLFFTEYQIAPYSSGMFKILIPYQVL